MIGILQGRLTRPWNGKLQCFPKSEWEGEFLRARECGFDAIELIVETEYNPDNPVWSEVGRATYRKLTHETGVAASTLCADCFMTTLFARDPNQSMQLLDRILGFGFKRVVLPFFEAAEIRSGDVDRIVNVLSSIDRRGVELALETTLRASELSPLADRARVGVCYDLGNTTALGHDVPGDIRALGSRIVHVHVKDKRRSDGQNVLLGTGDTNFVGAFAALREIGYKGHFTLETNRGEEPVETARKHKRFVEDRLR